MLEIIKYICLKSGAIGTRAGKRFFKNATEHWRNLLTRTGTSDAQLLALASSTTHIVIVCHVNAVSYLYPDDPHRTYEYEPNEDLAVKTRHLSVLMIKTHEVYYR